MSETDTELKGMIKSCLDGNRAARVHFQDLFGEFIYNYPLKMFRLPNDKAADFYIYVFEKDRIFKRLSGFEGRNDAQFKTYLGFYVLRDLFLEWQRSQKELETISFETTMPGNDPASKGATLHDILADPASSNGTATDSQEEAAPFRDILAGLDAEKRLVLKLLHLAEFDLSPQEIRQLCKKSGRTYKEIVTLIEEIRNGLRKKDEQYSSLQDQLDSIFGWILLYQKELAGIAVTLNSTAEGSSRYAELCRQKEEFERKLEWRYRQRKQILERANQFRITTPYKDIARLLNVPLGTVCSMIGRIREEVLTVFGSPEVAKQAAVS